MVSEFDILESVLGNITGELSGGRVFNPTLQYGSHADMLRYIRSVDKSHTVKYPLIWVETPFSTDHDYRKKTGETNLTIILATLSNQELSNTSRVHTTMAKTLEPLYAKVSEALINSKPTSIAGSTGKEVYFNYDSDEEKSMSDIWDAIKMTVTIRFKYSCLKK